MSCLNDAHPLREAGSLTAYVRCTMHTYLALTFSTVPSPPTRQKSHGGRHSFSLVHYCVLSTYLGKDRCSENRQIDEPAFFLVRNYRLHHKNFQYTYRFVIECYRSRNMVSKKAKNIQLQTRHFLKTILNLFGS